MHEVPGRIRVHLCCGRMTLRQADLLECCFRVAWIYTVFAYFHTISSLYLLNIFLRVITAIAEIIYFVLSDKKLRAPDALSPCG